MMSRDSSPSRTAGPCTTPRPSGTSTAWPSRISGSSPSRCGSRRPPAGSTTARASARRSPARRSPRPGLERLDGVSQRSSQDAPAEDPEADRERPSLEVLTVAYHDDVHPGRLVGPRRDGVGVAGAASPQVGVGGRHDDVVGIGPVVVQALPDAGGAFGDVGLAGALAVHLEVLVGTVAEELRAA